MNKEWKIMLCVYGLLMHVETMAIASETFFLISGFRRHRDMGPLEISCLGVRGTIWLNTRL